MTETEWHSCTNPGHLLAHVQGTVSARKLRLFMAACCLHLWGSSPHEGTRIAATMVEQLAEAGPPPGIKTLVRVTRGEARLDCGASDPLQYLDVGGPDQNRKRVPPRDINPLLTSLLENMACSQTGHPFLVWLLPTFEREGLSLDWQAALFRDIVRGPFRPLTLRAAWRTWDGGIVPALAAAAYAEPSPPAGRLDHFRLGVLADALEDAGCAEEELLSHLRGPGPHVRGCWVVDLLLNRE